MGCKRNCKEWNDQQRGSAASGKDARSRDALNAIAALRLHWPEYLMEAGELALYMFFACSFTTLLQHPDSPVRRVIASGVWRRALMGLAIGATVIAILMTPWGKQSGGHSNPAITFAFYRLGKMELWDALFYAAAQFCGAISGVAIAKYVLRGAPENDAIRYAVTAPGVYGNAVAFVAELAISFILMTTILVVSNRETLARYTPYYVGALYAHIHNLRDAAFRDEHESRTNVWLSIPGQLLARALDLFPCADIGHAGGRGGFSANSRGCRSLLCKAAPRQ
jgi:Major intrinsic protein